MAVDFSGEKIHATYLISDELGADVVDVARTICVEQTVEFPPDLIERADILEQVVARVVEVDEVGGEPPARRVVIAYPVEIAGTEITQLLNVLFGNVSLLPGIRLVDIELPPSLQQRFLGPRFGRAGLRDLLGVPERPLLATALKPMGLSAAELADLAGRFAAGGMDLIKDDHGLADQSFSPFGDRVSRCAEAVQEANARSGGRCLYFANVTAPGAEVRERAELARQAGAGGLVLSPGLTGLDALAALAGDDELALPIMSHPAFQGAFTHSPTAGMSHRVIYGQLNRLAGADTAIFPSFGGRFSFSKAECRDLVAGTACAMGAWRPIFPTPAGGMSLGRVGELIEFYGTEVILLIGGDLHRHGTSLVDACRKFAELVEPARE